MVAHSTTRFRGFRVQAPPVGLQWSPWYPLLGVRQACTRAVGCRTDSAGGVLHADHGVCLWKSADVSCGSSPSPCALQGGGEKSGTRVAVTYPLLPSQRFALHAGLVLSTTLTICLVPQPCLQGARSRVRSECHHRWQVRSRSGHARGEGAVGQNAGARARLQWSVHGCALAGFSHFLTSRVCRSSWQLEQGV